MTKQDDGLFLLEVLVDKIVFVKSPCFTDKDFKTCVLVECQGLEPLEVCDDDSDACYAKDGGPFIKTINRGKSCLFSMKEADIASAMSKFSIKISVYKSLPCGCLPTKITMGEATIDMTKEFVGARNKFLANPTSIGFEALKDSFRISGNDGTETGEIVMFLRISCFGKLIVTRFQGGGLPSLGTGAENNIVDRSCNSRKEYQTPQDRCSCGAVRVNGPGSTNGKEGASNTLGSGVCPPAKDLYNTMPCQDPDDPCYCTGPKLDKKSQMACRNTDQYCLHIPKGTILNLPNTQEMTEKSNINTFTTMDLINLDNKVGSNIGDRRQSINYKNKFINECVSISKDLKHLNSQLLLKRETYSIISFVTLRSKRSIPLSDTTNLASRSDCTLSGLNILKKYSKVSNYTTTRTCGANGTAVYMTLIDEIYQNSLSTNRQCLSTSGTQATASVNKCLQVQCKTHTNKPIDSNKDSYFHSSCHVSRSPCCTTNKLGRMKYSDVYFFSRKRDTRKQDSENFEKSGMGTSRSQSKLQRMSQTHTVPIKSESRTSQTRKSTESSASTFTKTVSIKDEKTCNVKNCPALMKSRVKGEMVATVSHITLGPRKVCPIHGQETCEGPKCTIDPPVEEYAPVKVTTMSNPRRGVFELVVRRLTGAPLARNELMLEWTPPPNRPSCSQPGSSPAPCRPSKCKLIICRPSSCQKKRCRKLCAPPCRTVPTDICKKCPPLPCTPCQLCRACPPPRKIFKRRLSSRCRPCRFSKPCKYYPTLSCGQCDACSKCVMKRKPRLPLSYKHSRQCNICCPVNNQLCPKSLCSACTSSLKSKRCSHLCPLRQKKSRKYKKMLKPKPRRKRISPCMNRSKRCPVVRCRSLPVSRCILPCSLRKCCSIISCSPDRDISK